MQGNYYPPRPAMENSNTPRGIIPGNSAVRGRGAGSIPRSGSGRFGGPGYRNFRELRPHDSSRRTVRSEVDHACPYEEQDYSFSAYDIDHEPQRLTCSAVALSSPVDINPF